MRRERLKMRVEIFDIAFGSPLAVGKKHTLGCDLPVKLRLYASISGENPPPPIATIVRRSDGVLFMVQSLQEALSWVAQFDAAPYRF